MVGLGSNSGLSTSLHLNPTYAVFQRNKRKSSMAFFVVRISLPRVKDNVENIKGLFIHKILLQIK